MQFLITLLVWWVLGSLSLAGLYVALRSGNIKWFVVGVVLMAVAIGCRLQ